MYKKNLLLTALLTLAPFALGQSSTSNAMKPVTPLAPADLPGRGLAQHPFFYAGEWDHRNPEQRMFIVRDGKVVWTYSIPLKTPRDTIQEYSDATMLSNGNILFAHMSGATLLSQEKKVLWHYEAPVGFEVHVAQPIGLDRVMIVQNGQPATMRLINLTTGETEKTVTLPTGNPGFSHGHFRRARLTSKGTLLAAHLDNNKIAEYDMDGKVVWAKAILSPWTAIRLKNGNTLVTCELNVAREYDPQGNIVWEFTQKDVPDIRLFCLQEAFRLANGNTILSNWCPNELKNTADWPKSVQVLEVTPDKKVVWALRSWDEPANLGPATNVQLLDEPGIPEKGEQQR